jgi:hypothetical protein
MNFNKRFSIAHFDRFRGEHADTFYHLMKNADPRYLANIHDIYFGKFFYYEWEGKQKRCGNPMGVEASDTQVDWLFKLQEETGVEISLTFNTIEVPHEVIWHDQIREQFVEWIGSYYDRGLRSCTMSSEHLMRMGVLQQRCPDMRWKSTVNQIVADAQQFIDMAYLGYNSINLDRSLNRNLKELKRIKRAQDYLNSKNPQKKVITILLIAEACIYHCPFKKEHDSVGEVVSTEYFSGPADLSCNAWRSVPEFALSPRSGINVVASTSATFKQFADLVDVFKYSGRLTQPASDPKDLPFLKAAWFHGVTSKFKQPHSTVEQTVYANDFHEIYDNDLGPIHDWVPGWVDTRQVANDWHTTYKPHTGVWSSDQGKKLEKLLLNCRSQCWDCHECERTFGMGDIDSALQMRINSTVLHDARAKNN